MSIISAVIGAVAASGPSKTVTWGGIYYTPIQEGQEQHVDLNYSNWDSSTIYWTIKNNLGAELTSQVTPVSGSFNPGSGSGSHAIYFTFNADATTDGPLTYYVWVGSGAGQQDYLTSDPYTVRDSSQTPALVLDVDPASLSSPLFGLNGWTDASGQGNNLSIANGSKSADNGGVLVFNGTSTYAGDVMNANLNTSTYSTVSVSAWIKPDVVTGLTQAIIAKELSYKLEITTNGSIAWMVKNSDGGSWTTTIFADPGLVTTSTWSHVAATVNSSTTQIYINGVLAQTGSGQILSYTNNGLVIGAYDAGGTISDFFGGRMGEVKMWNYAITATSVVSYYNSTAARYGQTPVAQSLLFNGGTQGHPLFVNGNTGDWALGTNGTIEWWEKISSTASSYYGNFNGGILVQGNAGAGLGANGIDIFAAGAPGTGINSNVGGNITTSWPELTTGTWVHVAMSISSGLQQFYYNGVAQNNTDGNRSANLQNALDTLRVGNRVPGANYQNFTGLISNLHISTATLYTSTFTPMIRTATTTGTVLLLDCYNPTVDLSYYELNGLNTSANNGLNIYFSTSTYPNLINQIQVGNRITSPNTSTVGTVTGPVTLADPSNWGVPVTNLPEPGPLNFSGARHTTTGTVTLTTDAPV